MSVNDRIKLFVPGRLCLFGEHSDWAGQMRKFNSDILPGRALVACTEEGIYATARVCDKLKLRAVLPDGESVELESDFQSDKLYEIAAGGGFFSYMAGVAAYIATYYDIGGIEIECYKMTLPQKKGLSSSAAICTLTARAFNRLYGLNLTVRGEMEAAYHGELLTPSRCGRLDQACGYGKGIVDMTFDGDLLDVSPVKVGGPLHFVFADLKAAKDTITILRDLNAAYPYSRTDKHIALHDLLGKHNKSIVQRATCAIEAGDAEALGELMREAQEKFDCYAAPLSPVELKAEKLHAVLNDSNLAQWVYGGKGVGSQGDGSVQFVAKCEDSQEKLVEYLNNKLGLDCYSLTVPKTKSVRKAVIPIAGHGTRMYPATKTMKKELFPVIDIDGYAKPALLVIFDELINAGIEEICLIIRLGDEDLYLSLFQELKGDYKFPDGLKAYEQKLSSLRDKIVFAYQDQMLGFGHAVLQSAVFAGDEPVVLMLGDHIYHSKRDLNCVSQLIAAYEKSEALTIGLFEIPSYDAPKYGVAKGEIIDEESSMLRLSALVEKPAAEYAKENLGIQGKLYGIFMYVLTRGVYEALEQQFRDGETEFDEFQLTPALNAVAAETGAYGALIEGERFDIGTPSEYRATVEKFGKSK